MHKENTACVPEEKNAVILHLQKEETRNAQIGFHRATNSSRPLS